MGQEIGHQFMSPDLNQTPEQVARDRIGSRLRAAGWHVQDKDVLARLPQLEGFEVCNPLIFLNPTPKGRHYTAADGQRVARRHEESRGAPCAGRVMPSWCSRSSCSFRGWV